MSNAELLRARYERIRARVWDAVGEPGEPAFVAVYCNRCGAEAVADTVDELAPKILGWRLDEDDGRGMDYCPRCLQ